MANIQVGNVSGNGPDSGPELLLGTSDAVEQVWVRYWAPLLSGGGLAALKGELFDAWHLVNEARKVYRHCTGGLCDDLTASADGIIAADGARVALLTDGLVRRVADLEAELRACRLLLKAESGPEPSS